jgi:hypothetical protein
MASLSGDTLMNIQQYSVIWRMFYFIHCGAHQSQRSLPINSWPLKQSHQSRPRAEQRKRLRSALENLIKFF